MEDADDDTKHQMLVNLLMQLQETGFPAEQQTGCGGRQKGCGLRM